MQAGGKDKSKLPSKVVIMKAVAQLDIMIKEVQKESEKLFAEREVSIKEEEAERDLEAKRAEEEEKKIQAARAREAEERKRQEDELRESRLQKALNDKQPVFDEARKRSDDDLEEQIQQAKDDERMRCFEEMESQIMSASSGFDNDISKVRKDLEKARIAVEKAEAKVASVEAEYKTMMQAEEEKAEAQQTDSAKGGPPSIANLIDSINADNRRRAAEAHALSLSLAFQNDAEYSVDEQEEELELHLSTYTDPKYRKTPEEWSIMAKRVTGLSDAIYTDPSEAPYYEHHEKNHALIGPTVKEYVRDKQRRLLEHWTELAEEYEVRKRLYDKQQSRLAKKGKQRESVSLAGRKSILGDKATDREGSERGANILESSGRTSNNPYRRARRGNEVRSEYEQEQIIAEIAAKEAMERRIAHGGSKLPRQICRLEKVRSGNFHQWIFRC